MTYVILEEDVTATMVTCRHPSEAKQNDMPRHASAQCDQADQNKSMMKSPTPSPASTINSPASTAASPMASPASARPSPTASTVASRPCSARIAPPTAAQQRQPQQPLQQQPWLLCSILPS